MILTVHVPAYQLEEDGRILNVGDEVAFWLSFDESARWPAPAEHLQVIRGLASPLPGWPEGEDATRSVRIDIDGGALYWEAPEAVAGVVETAGRVSVNDVMVPDDFPSTSGVVRRIRMERMEFVYRVDGWRNEDGQARYEEVSASYLPIPDFGPIDPEVEQAAIREALERRAASGNPVRDGDSIVVGVSIERDVAVGSTKTNWTGVLIDLETTGLVDE